MVHLPLPSLSPSRETLPASRFRRLKALGFFLRSSRRVLLRERGSGELCGRWLYKMMPLTLLFFRRYAIHEYETLIDSSEVELKDWIRIANDIELNYKLYDAFVVLHGTDSELFSQSPTRFGEVRSPSAAPFPLGSHGLQRLGLELPAGGSRKACHFDWSSDSSFGAIHVGLVRLLFRRAELTSLLSLTATPSTTSSALSSLRDTTLFPRSVSSSTTSSCVATAPLRLRRRSFMLSNRPTCYLWLPSASISVRSTLSTDLSPLADLT